MAPGPSGWAQAGEPQRASSKRTAQTIRIRILLGGSVERFLRVPENKVSAASEKRPGPAPERHAVLPQSHVTPRLAAASRMIWTQSAASFPRLVPARERVHPL